MGQDAFVDVGLTWRVTPEVSEGRANRTTVRTRVRTSWWEAIVGKLLREIGEKVLNNFLPLILEVQVVVYTTCAWAGMRLSDILALSPVYTSTLNRFQSSFNSV